LAAALELPGKIKNPTNEKIKQAILDLGYDLNPMKGIAGEFYTEHRYEDLIALAKELLDGYKT